RAAMRMLEKESFAYEGYVDIFDGGPTMLAKTDQVKSVADSVSSTIVDIDLSEGDRAIIATGSLSGFRACYGARQLDEDGMIAIDSASADALDVTTGDTVWSVGR
ncbi:MAG: arginine N-succinyltransferase, partial [Pseudomonadota bacterium]